MGKLYKELQRQLKIEEHKKDAEDCLKIYDKLKEINNGSIWESQWNPLVLTVFEDWYTRTYHPTAMGRVFLNGL